MADVTITRRCSMAGATLHENVWVGDSAAHPRWLGFTETENSYDLVAARGGGAEQCEDFFFGEDALGLFGDVENAINQFVRRGDAAFFQPENHVGAAAERANFNHLLEAEEMRGHAAVN